MKLSNGMQMLLKRITNNENADLNTYYNVINDLDVLEPMIQSSEKLGKVPIGKHSLDIYEQSIDFQSLLK